MLYHAADWSAISISQSTFDTCFPVVLHTYRCTEILASYHDHNPLATPPPPFMSFQLLVEGVNIIQPSLLFLKLHNLNLLLFLAQSLETKLVPIFQLALLLSQLRISPDNSFFQTSLITSKWSTNAWIKLLFGYSGKETIVNVVLTEGGGFFVTLEGTTGVPHLVCVSWVAFCLGGYRRHRKGIIEAVRWERTNSHGLIAYQTQALGTFGCHTGSNQINMMWSQWPSRHKAHFSGCTQYAITNITTTNKP